jgi:hypothetical protein
VTTIILIKSKNKLLQNFKKNGDLSSLSGNWQVQTKWRQAVVVLRILTKGTKNDLVQGIYDGIDSPVEPLNVEKIGKSLKDPSGSGGFPVICFQL